MIELHYSYPSSKQKLMKPKHFDQSPPSNSSPMLSCRHVLQLLRLYGISIHQFYINNKKIEMGCGAVCGIQPPSPNKYAIYSQAKILQLYPKIKICKPLLTETTLLRFSQGVHSPQNQYILKAGERVSTDEEIQAQIMEKWRIILYGLDKDDENYKKCLSFQVRNGKQQVTNSQNLINNSSLTQNKSYHQLKPNTQYHECFTQIEKDLNRTFQFKQEKKKIFENILKRISNYFPSMGYTQGVNFVVGYLLIIGYSQSDTFWMFSHLALNQRYLVLGLYEDGFPLAYIYTSIFKNMLKRLDSKLHDHLFMNLMLDESMWIFKWFITYYIYSFPFSTIKYIWNLVIELGGIALVYYALALVMHIRHKLLQIEDPCDISQFLQGLKELNRFNELIKMNQIVTKVYQLNVLSEDLKDIKTFKPSIYKSYYQHFDEISLECRSSHLAAIKESSTSRIIHDWYEKIMAERVEFQSTSIQKERGGHLPDILKSEYLDLQKSINILEQKIIQNQSIKMSKLQPTHTVPTAPTRSEDYFGELIHNEPITITLKDQAQIQMNDQQFRSRNITKMSYDMDEEINEVDGQSDSNSELEEVSCQNVEQDKPAVSIEVDEESFHKITKESPHNGFSLKVNTIVGQIDHRKKIIKQSNPKANNIKIGEQKRTGLALAAHNILCNLSVTNSQYSSNSSKNTSFKPKKHKQNHLFRYNKNSKVKTEQVSQPSMDPSSSRGSSIDHHTDKESFSGMTHRENPNNQRPSIIINDRKTQQQFMINSQGPDKLNDNGNISKQMTSQIQIFNGDGLFKKKKKIYNRNSNIISINQNMGKSSQKIQEIQCYSKRTLNQRNKNFTYNQQESIDAILYQLSARKTSQQHKKQLDAMIYEIESIK